MSEFTSRSKLRQFELRLKNESVYVNAHFLAEQSPYFNRMCFDDCYKEARDGRVVMEGVELSDILALLDYLCPDKNYMYRKRISDNNLAALIHCSHRFQFPNLLKELEHFITQELESDEIQMKSDSLVDAILEAQDAGFKPSLMTCLYKKFASLGEENVQPALSQLPPDLAAVIRTEIAKYMQVIVSPELRSAYNWNEFSARMFF